MEKAIVNSTINNDLSSLKKEQKQISSFISINKEIILDDIRYVAGVDITYKEVDSQEYGVCCIVVYDILRQKDVEVVIKEYPIDIPYIPGFLCYREYPLFKKTLRFLTIEPDIFMFDGNGSLHERKCGLAVYAGYKSDVASIGVSKSRYISDGISYTSVRNSVKGSYGEIYKDEELIGYELISKTGAAPIYVSSGYSVSNEFAKELTLRCMSDVHSIPEPTRLADRYSRDYIKGEYTFNDKLHREKLKEFCVSICKERTEQNFNNFVDFLVKNNFFDNMSNSDVNNIIKTGIPNKLSNNFICIGFSSYKEKLEIGIDPKECYNKCSSCSILIDFPLNKRSYQQVEKYLSQIFNKKSEIYKEWIKNADSCWYGKWATFK